MHGSLKEYTMLRSLSGSNFTRNEKDENYCLIRFWISVKLKFRHICLKIQPILAVHIY